MGNNSQALMELIKPNALCVFEGGATTEPDYTGVTNRIRVFGLTDPGKILNLSFSPRTGDIVITALQTPGGPEFIKSISVGKKFTAFLLVMQVN